MLCICGVLTLDATALLPRSQNPRLARTPIGSPPIAHACQREKAVSVRIATRIQGGWSHGDAPATLQDALPMVGEVYCGIKAHGALWGYLGCVVLFSGAVRSLRSCWGMRSGLSTRVQ